MARVKKSESSDNRPKLRPAISEEAQESRMISLAVNLVEQRLIDGTASSQETTHYLKLATKESKLKLENLKLQNELTKAKTKQIENEENRAAMFDAAIKAMQKYTGNGDGLADEDD